MDFTTPQGFRDVLADEAIARECMVRNVQDVLAQAGYMPIETPTLESMQVMREGGRIPASPFKFFDATGELVTMRPDVTLQVARMCATRLGSESGPFRLRYIQRVFREMEGQVGAGARERKQIGIECIGASGPQADAEVVALFAQALEAAGIREFSLSLATVGVLRALLIASEAPESWTQAVLEAFHKSDFVSLDTLCSAIADSQSPYARAIMALSRIKGGREAIDTVRELVDPLGCASALDDFEQTFALLEERGLGDRILIDFSVMSSFDYYTGMVFEAFAPGLGRALGSGGRYDTLLARYGVDRPAAGFAFYLEEVQAAIRATAEMQDDRPLRIAVPKGSLNADTIEVLKRAGLDTTGLENPGRTLIISNPGVDYIIVRPSDAPVFVEMGAADCGICGEDSLLETRSDVVQLVDLRFGSCRFIVAEPQGASERTAERYRSLGSLRVATKYPNIARAHFARTGVQVEIVQLHGNIELGPLTGLADCIVDITATGTTLRENNLVVTEEVTTSTARFFANVCSFRIDRRVHDLAARLAEQVRGSELKVTAGGQR